MEFNDLSQWGKLHPLLKSGTNRALCPDEPKAENCCIIWKIYQSLEESTVLYVKQKEKKGKKRVEMGHGSEDSQVSAREASSSHGGWSLPDTFFATLLDWAGRLRLNCPPLRRAWSGHVLSLGIIRTYQLQCSPLVACHLHQAGYRRTDLRPPWRWERCDDREKGGGERGGADREWVRQRHMKEAGTL